MWTFLRCLIEITSGVSGDLHQFGNCHSVFEIAVTYINLNDDQRLAALVFTALAVAGAIDVCVMGWHLLFRRNKGP